ncbi:sugar ABC transporter substrate-binding protein [Clostridium sp. DL1XJH146]
MKVKFQVVLLVLVAMISSLLVGCTGGNPNNSTSNNEVTNDGGEAATITREDNEEYKIGFITSQFGHSVPMAWSEGIEKELAYFENVTYQSFDGEGKAEVQETLMQDLINQEYDVIVLQALDAAALSAVTTQAEEAGIFVITLNLDVAVDHAALVQMVDYQAGVIVADEIAKATGEEGNVVILQSPPGATLGVNREQGFRDRLAEKYPNMEIIAAQNAEWMKDKAISVMNNILQANDKIDGVYAINDSMAEGAAIAADSAGRLDEMVIWGADGERDALTMIEQGKLTGTVYTNCYDQGATAARLAMFLLSSNTHPTEIPKTGVIEIAPVAVTQDNVDTIREEDRW